MNCRNLKKLNLFPQAHQFTNVFKTELVQCHLENPTCKKSYVQVSPSLAQVLDFVYENVKKFPVSCSFSHRSEMRRVATKRNFLQY